MVGELFQRAVEAHMSAETDEQRRALGKLMRDRILTVLDTPRAPGRYDHIVPTRGKKFDSSVAVGELRIKFELESDSEDSRYAEDVSLAIPALGEMILLHENGESEIKRVEQYPTTMRAKTPLPEMLQYFGMLGLIESQFLVKEVPTELLPDGVVPINRS